MDIKVNNSWLNESDNENVEENNETNAENEPIEEISNEYIDNKTFDDLMNVPRFKEKININKFLNDETKEIKSEKKKRLFNFNKKNEIKINYYYVIPVVGVLGYFMFRN